LHSAGDGCLFRHPAVEADDKRGYRNFTASLPKTGSGKIRRRHLKPVTLEREPCDIAAIDDEGSAPEAHVAGHAVRQAQRKKENIEEEEVVAWQTWRCRIG
jgi:hypothetical protein